MNIQYWDCNTNFPQGKLHVRASRTHFIPKLAKMQRTADHHLQLTHLQTAWGSGNIMKRGRKIVRAGCLLWTRQRSTHEILTTSSPKQDLHNNNTSWCATVDVMKAVTKCNLGKKGFVLSYDLTVLHEGKAEQELKAGTWSRSLGGMPLTGLLPVAGSSCFLTYPRTTCPGLAPPTVGLTSRINH